MKKLMASIMAIGMMCAASVPAFAADTTQTITNEAKTKSATINLNVVGGTYSITIPESVDAVASGASDGKWKATLAKPTLTAGAVLNAGDTLKVHLSGYTGTGVLSLSDTSSHTVPGKLTDNSAVLTDIGTTAAGHEVLSVAAADAFAGDDTSGKEIVWTSDNPVPGGTYTGTVTYTASIVNS